MKLLIQIPCFNEAGTLHLVMSDLPISIAGIDSIETLVVDDGSTDGTAAVALALGVDHVVRHKANCGLATAFATGIDSCLELGADIIVNTDGDHQYPGKSIERLVQPIISKRADVVIGDRKPAMDPRIPMVKRWFHQIGRQVVSLLAGKDLVDPVSGFRAMSREAAIRTHILTTYSYTIESLLQAVHKGLAVEFVPVPTNPPTRRSRLMRSVPQFIARSSLTLLRVFFMFHAISVLIWLSIVLAVVGIAPIARFLWMFATGNGDGHLHSLILGATLFVLAGLTFVAGLIADLIAHNRRLHEMTLERLRRLELKGVSKREIAPRHVA